MLTQSPSWQPGRFRATFQTLNRRAYVLEFKNSANETNWTGLPAVPGNGSLRLLADPSAAASQRFHRVRHSPR